MQMTRICLDFFAVFLLLFSTLVHKRRMHFEWKNKKESLMSGIFFHASMPHYDLDKGVGGVVTKA